MPNRVIRDERFDPERSLANRTRVVSQKRVETAGIDCTRDPQGRVVTDYFPRELPAGDPASESGVQVSFNELDAELQALILAGGGGGNLRVRELDGSPDVQPVDDIRVPNGSVVSVGGSTIQFLFAAYAGSFETATIGTGDIPAGQWGYWYDTSNNQQWLVRNRAGTLFYVELTC
jgi:hypothetical protein